MVRRRLFRVFPSAAAIIAFVHLARGGFRGFSSLDWPDAAAVVLLLVGLAQSAALRVRRSPMEGFSLREDLELGGGLLIAASTVVALVGPPVFPLLYLLMAFLVSFLQRNAALTLLGVGTVLTGVLTLGRSESFLARTIFLVLFSALYHFALSVRMAIAKRAESEAVKRRIQEVEEQARTFRLVSSGTQDSLSGMSSEEKWLLASVKEVEGAVSAALEIAEAALHTHTCAAFLLSSDDRSLKLHDCRSQSDRVQRESFNAGEGVLGGVLKRGASLRMAAESLKGITYYQSGAPHVKALLAAPIMDGRGLMRGVLVADRLSVDPFTDAEERLLTTVAAEVHRAIEVERVMGYIRKNRDEKDRFFKAIEELNRAGNPDQVFLAVLESVRQLAPVDFCAVTLVSEAEGKRVHRIAQMSGVSAASTGLLGKTFLDNNGLVANVVRYGVPLPGRDVRDMDRQVIFDAGTVVRGLSALKIFPLTAGGRILGTLVVGARKKGALDSEVLRMMEVMAISAAQAVLRAQLFEQMEKMATTDGMTGLLNHRTFQQKLDEVLAQARRYGRKASLILTDVDHFKSVNDTYGHPTGDMVLKRVAKIVKDKARDTDIVARYGGEEFAIVMPETDAKGAAVIAERIREALQLEVMQTEVGPLKVTLSLGIATCPDHSTDKQQLIDLADQCLYFAKRHGRNQVVGADRLNAGDKRAANG